MHRESPEEFPETRSASDWLVPAAKGVAGGVPVVGGLLGEVIGFVWTPSLQRRQADWFKQLGARLNELEVNVGDLRDRLSTPDVLTVVANAARAATATHEETKRAALRAAVINTALEIEPDEQMRLMFVALIDRLTAGHLRLLTLFKDPRRFFEDAGVAPPEPSLTNSISGLIKSAFPEWDSDLASRVAVDLDDMGLTEAAALNATMTSQGTFQPRVTPIGQRFLRFIEDDN